MSSDASVLRDPTYLETNPDVKAAIYNKLYTTEEFVRASDNLASALFVGIWFATNNYLSNSASTKFFHNKMFSRYFVSLGVAIFLKNRLSAKFIGSSPSLI